MSSQGIPIKTTVVYDWGSFAHRSSVPFPPPSSSVSDGVIRRRVTRVDLSLALGGHRKKKDGLLARSSFAPRLVLASPRQCHEHGRVLPGAVGVVVVALKPLQEVTFVRRSFLWRQKPDNRSEQLKACKHLVFPNEHDNESKSTSLSLCLLFESK